MFVEAKVQRLVKNQSSDSINLPQITKNDIKTLYNNILHADAQLILS